MQFVSRKLRFKLEFMFSRIHKSFDVTKGPLRTVLVLFLVLSATGWLNAASTSTQQAPGSSAGFDSNFAIADFDGDRKPDLATVEIQQGTSSSTTQYSIRLKLTTGAAQVFGVIAPAGGLQIVARDVNGDDALDVLVSTAWQHKQVAVLLNDGHGKFALADPAAFPALIWQCDTLWKNATMPLWESGVLIRSQSSAGEFKERNAFLRCPSRPGKRYLRVSPGVMRLLDFSLLGRAPPTFVFRP